jgi:uncharacterized protein (DUF427 family)
MVQARWNGAVIADSHDTIVVEGNHYFPRAAVDAAVLSDSATTSFCPWKGSASYHHVTVDGQVNKTPPGIMPSPRMQPPRSRTASPFGKALRSADRARRCP